nr:hypothetical protein [uncultured Holophaga sp.]
MLSPWVLSLSLLCAAPGSGSAPSDAVAKALVEESAHCLQMDGQSWDDNTWSNVFAWNVCLEERLFSKLTEDQKQVIKAHLAKLGYYRYDAKRKTFSNARKRIQPGDMESILSVIRSVVLAGERCAPSPDPKPVPPQPVPPPRPPVPTGPAMSESEARTLVDTARQCLQRTGKTWDERRWMNIYEWDTSLEAQVLTRLPEARKEAFKASMAQLGYYVSDPDRHTYASAQKKIQEEDVERILALLSEAILPGRGDSLMAPPLGQGAPPLPTAATSAPAADLGPALPEAEALALLEESRVCLQKRGKGWDDVTWSNIFEWNVCLERQLFSRLTEAQTRAIKGQLTKLGYYAYDKKKQTFSNARRRIREEDVDTILAAIRAVILPGK